MICVEIIPNRYIAPIVAVKGRCNYKVSFNTCLLYTSGVPKIALKAIVTEHNCGWSFYKLYEELKEEHRLMTEQAQAPQMEAGASDGEGSL